MKTIKEEKISTGNNETLVKRGVYQLSNGSYMWVTFSRSGESKRLSTAVKNAGF